MVCILADTDLGETVQSSITERTELHTDRSAGGIVKPCQEIGERSEHAHHIHRHEIFDGVDMLDERFDDRDELDRKLSIDNTNW